MAKIVTVKAHKRLSPTGKIENVKSFQRHLDYGANILKRESRVREFSPNTPEKSAQQKRILNELQKQFSPNQQKIGEYMATAKQRKIR